MGPDEVILLLQSGCSAEPGASADPVGLPLLSCTFRQRLGVLGSEWACEPPAPGSWVGLSQSECYCKVSGCTGKFLPLCILDLAPPCTAPPASTEQRHLLEVLMPAPVSL